MHIQTFPPLSIASTRKPASLIRDHLKSEIIDGALIHFFSPYMNDRKDRASVRLDIGTPPNLPPQGIIDKLKEAQDKVGFHTYSEPQGEDFFLDAISKYMEERFGVKLDPKNEIFVISGGTNKAIYTLLTTKFLAKGAVMLPSPGYPAYYSSAKLGERDICTIPLTQNDNYQPDLNKALLSNNVNVLIINYPQNPTGVISNLKYFKKVIDFAKEHKIIVISDLSFSEIYPPNGEKPPSIFQIPDAKEVAVEIHGFSKTFNMTGDRIAFLVGNSDIITELIKLTKLETIGNAPKPLQYAAAFALSDPDCRQFVQNQNIEYATRREMMVDGLKDLGWPVSDEHKSRGGFFIWTAVPEKNKTGYEFADDLLERAGILMIPGIFFGQEGENYIRMSLLQEKEILGEVLNSLKQSGFEYS